MVHFFSNTDYSYIKTVQYIIHTNPFVFLLCWIKRLFKDNFTELANGTHLFILLQKLKAES